jgi:hypothetical protein
MSSGDLTSLIKEIDDEDRSPTTLHKLRSRKCVLNFFKSQSSVLSFPTVIRESDIPWAELFLSLGPLITSTSSEKRKIGYQLVRDALSKQHRCFSDQEMRLIGTFFTNRLKDETSALEGVLKILIQVVSLNLPDDVISTLFDTISKELAIPSLHVEERFHLFQLVSRLVDKHLETLRSIIDFPLNFSQVFESERDPRCLLVFFDVFSKTIPKLSHITPYEEEIFDSIGCYFPVSYHPRHEDPYAISREDLAHGLNKCLCCHPSFATPFFQLILEKLSSDRETAKIDSYRALTQSLPFFTIDSIKPYVSILWTYVRTDVMKTAVVEEMKEAAISALLKISSALMSDNELLESFITDVSNDLQPFIVKRNLNLRRPAYDLYIACSSSSPLAFKQLWKSIIPHLMGGLAFDDSKDNKISILEFLDRVTDPVMLTGLNQETLSNMSMIIAFCVPDQNEEPEFVFLKLKVLTHVIGSGLSINDDDLEIVNGHLLKVLTCHSDNSILTELAKLMKSLEQQGTCIVDDIKKYVDSMTSQVDFSKVLVILEAIDVSFLWQNDLLTLFQLKLNQANIASIPTISSIITLLISQWKQDTGNIQLLDLFESLLRAYLKLEDNGQEGKVLEALGMTSSKLSKVEATELCHNLRLRLKGDKFQKLIRIAAFFVKFSPTSDLSSWIEMVRNFILDKPLQEVLSIGMLITSIAFRCTDDHLDELHRMLNQNEKTLKNLQILKFIATGICLRGHKYLAKYIEEICEYFEDVETRHETSQVIISIHQEIKDEGTTKSTAAKTFLHQKLFFISIPLLTKRLDSFHTKGAVNEKSSLKHAIIGQLIFLPKSVLKNDLKKIHPLIISCLSSNPIDTQTTITTLECILYLLEDKSSNQMICNNLSSILTSLIEQSQEDKTLKVRSSALTCLSKIAVSLPEKNLLSHRPHVVKKLKSSLDDKKRVVRKSASEACHNWILLGQPGNNASE